MRLSILLAAALALQTVSVQLNWHAPAKSSEAVVGYNVYRANAGSAALGEDQQEAGAHAHLKG